MESFDYVRERISNFIEKNSKLTVTITFTLIFLVLAGLVIIFYETATLPKPLKKSDVDTGQVFSENDSFFVPEEKPLFEEHYFSREADESWNEEETDRWFTVPDKNYVDTLSESNRQKTNKILGAAP